LQAHDCRLFFDVLRWSLQHDSLENSRSLEKLLNQLGQDEFSEYWHRLRRLSPTRFETLSRAFSIGQIESKLWLVEVLSGVIPRQEYNICIVAGWVGVLPRIMAWLAPHLIRRMTIVEWDGAALDDARRINSDLIDAGRLELIQADANQFEYGHDYHLIINCACEHFVERGWYDHIPEGRLLVTQSTNSEEPDHVRRVHSVSELTEQYPVDLQLYGGTLYLREGKRYMRIGRK
jgi:hypothetical protein